MPSLKGEMMIISQKIDCCRHALCALSKLFLIVLNKMENNSSVESWFYCLSSNICQFIYFSVASSYHPFLAFFMAGVLFRPLISHPFSFPSVYLRKSCRKTFLFFLSLVVSSLSLTKLLFSVINVSFWLYIWSIVSTFSAALSIFCLLFE